MLGCEKLLVRTFSKLQSWKSCALSIMRPKEVLMIIHDKMDNAKIACLCYARKMKATNGLFKLPIAIRGL